MIASILASLSIIILPVTAWIPTLGNCNQGYSGGYDEKTSTVYVCYSANEKDVEFVKYHEVGHHYWFKFMTQTQRDEYTKLYKRDLKKWKFYREYWKTNPVESFADDFSVVVTRATHKNTRLPFIRKLIKNVH